MSKTPDILGDNEPLVNRDFVITLTKDNSKSIDHELLQNCKIIFFTEEWNFDEIVMQISQLDSKICLNLFTFIVETSKINSSESIDTLKTFLINFGENRSLILQLTIKGKNFTKFYFKEENGEKFLYVDQQKNGDSGDFSSFSSFLLSYLNKSNNIENLVTKKLAHIQNSSLILKFVRTLDLPEELIDHLVLKCAAEGSTLDLLAAADGYIDDKRRICGNELNYYLSCEFEQTSVLQTAIKHSNEEVIDFLIKRCTHLIPQLSFQHQVLITTSTFNTNKIEVLCDLLEVADFPFPENLNSESIIEDINLQRIINEHAKFHEHVLNENNSEIKKFEEKHPKLKYVYNLENKSALGNALDSRRYKAFYFLKSLRFCDQQIESLEDGSGDAEDKKKARIIASKQRRKNVGISRGNQQNSALILATKSLIYHRNRSNEAEHEQRTKIREWLENIYATKYGSKLLDAAVQCEELKMIFDFECESTKNADPSATSESLGSTYPVSKWIFIGAKFTGEKEREQEIKGVIAHEICHYVMRLVYQNNEKPYYEFENIIGLKFEEVVADIKSILFPSKTEQLDDVSDDEDENEPIDDECDGIISTVYTLYNPEDYQPELIVRPVQIQVQFDDAQEKFSELEDMYKILFAFFDLFVILELKKFNLNHRQNVQKFNSLAGLQCKIKALNVKFLEPKDLKGLKKNQLSIVTTNTPILFLAYIYEFFREESKELFDFRNIFMSGNILENSYAYEKFKDIINQDQQINVIVDCSKNFGKIIEFAGSKHKFIFIVSDEKQQEELNKNLCSKNLDTDKLTIDYKWMDLADKSKEKLLQTKVNFQNNSNISLLELINSNYDQESEKETCFDNIVDDTLLNLLPDKNRIVINQFSEEDVNDKYLRIMFQSRNLIKKSERKKTKEPKLTSDKQSTTSSAESNSNQIQPTKELDTVEQDQIIENNKTKEPKLTSDMQPTTSSFENISNQIQPAKELETVEQDQIVENTRNLKFVLISGKTGSGKSWLLKTLTNKLKKEFPKTWIAYIDLKKFIEEFKVQDPELEFAGFMTEKIIKAKTKFESQIFKKLYKNGKVCILFDGFDEIAPDCAEFVTKLFQSFQQNVGNQLWIATRDKFEVNLKEKLEIDTVYKINDFTEENGINLIASSWFFDELRDENENLNEIFGINVSEKLKGYTNLAEKLNEKIPKSQNDSVELPQLYKMIADITTTNKEESTNYTTFKLFEKCVDMQNERWSKENGQQTDLDFHKLHQLAAMESLFPDKTDFCGLSREHLTDEEMVACSLLRKNFGKLSFSNETFREYYAAKFILEMLTKSQDHENVSKFLLQFLTTKKFENIRMFMNDAFGEENLSEKVMLNIPVIAKNLDQTIQNFETSSDVFEENFQNLAEFVIEIFKHSNKDKVKKVLLENKKISISTAKHTNLFVKVKNMILDYFNEEELTGFLQKNDTLPSIIASIPDAETAKDFINGVKQKTEKNPEFISKVLKMENKQVENILIGNSHFEKFKQSFDALNKSLTVNETINVGKLHQFRCTELEKAIKSVDFANNMTESHKVIENLQNVIQNAVICDKIDFHKTFWEFMLNTFENPADMKNFIMQNIKYGNNYVHSLVLYNKPEIMDFTIRKIKENFSIGQYEEILKSKGQWGRNLLQKAACSSADIKKHQILWKVFRDFYESDKDYLKFLKETDEQNNNVFHIAAVFTPKEIFEFMIKELKKTASDKETKNILILSGYANRNLLQSAVIQNKSVEFHEYLWTTAKKHLNSEEMLNMINHTNEDRYNLLFCAVEFNSIQVLELTWTQIKKIVTKIRSNSTFREYLSYVNNNQENILHMLMKSNDSEKFKFVCSDLANYFSKPQLRDLLRQKNSKEDQRVLHYAAKYCNEIKVHEIFWEILLNAFEKREKLKDLIMKNNKNGNNYFHLLVSLDKSEIVDFTIRMIKQNLSYGNYHEILNSKGQFGRNVLQYAACSSKDIQTHQILWQIFQDFYKSGNEFLEFLNKVDKDKNNVFHIAAAFSSKEILEFMIDELEKIASNKEMKGILRSSGNFKKINLLHLAVRNNKSVELHEYLWTITKNYFKQKELLNMIYQYNLNGDRLIHSVVAYNTKEVVELTWREIKKIIMLRKDQIKYLKSKGFGKRDLLQRASNNEEHGEEVQSWVESLANEYK